MSELIDGIFELSKLDSPDYPFAVEASDITEFTREIATEYYEVFEEQKFHFLYDIPDSEIIVPFNATWLYRAVSNILSNAIQYNPRGTAVELKLAATGRSRNSHYRRWHRNPGWVEGKGLRCLCPRRPGPKKRWGTGLGLAIAKQVVEKHGGNIRLITNGCTKFILFLPNEL